MRICSVDGCGKRYSAKGLCKNHYYRQKDYGRLHKVRGWLGATCSVSGCGRQPVAHDLCGGHYDQQRAGKPLAPLQPWRHNVSLLDPAPAIHRRGSRISEVFSEIRSKAVVRKKEWSLKHEDIFDIVRGPCSYCVAPSQWPRGYTGLDRVDNARGYHVDNVVGCCRHCNSAKGQRSVDEFREWAQRLYRTLFPEP